MATTIERLEPAMTHGERFELRLLDRVTKALGSPRELEDVLQGIADLVLGATGADHASVFCLDGRYLHPVVGAARGAAGLGSAFGTMGPVEVDLTRWGLFTEGRVVTIDDARRTDLIPRRWIDRFSVRAVAMVALWAGGEPCGLLATDWSEPHAFHPDELDELRTLGRYAALAVGAARPFEAVQRRARLHETMARGAAELGLLAGPQAVVDKLVDTYTELLEPRSCGVALLWSGTDRLTTLASATGDLPRPLPMSEVPPALVETLETWNDVLRPVELGPDPWLASLFDSQDAWYLALPLVVEDAPRGAVMLGFGEHRHLTAEERRAADTLAAVGSVALDRHRLLAQFGRQLSRQRALYHLSAALTEGTGSVQVVTLLNELLAEQGLEIVDVVLRDERLAGQLRAADEVERADGIPASDRDASVVVPMRLGRRVVGSLKVRPVPRDRDEREFVDALATGLAEVFNRGALRAAAEEAAREGALADERERMAHDLHDTAGQLFVAISMLTQRLIEELPADGNLVGQAERLVTLAADGKSAVEDAVRGLTFLPVPKRGLVPSLRAFVRSFAADSHLDVSFDVTGHAGRLSAPVEHALFRVAHEAMVNAWRHANCGRVRVNLLFRTGEIVLRVRDDGDGLAPDKVVQPAGFGTKGLRHAVMQVGGKLRVTNARPHGVLVEARVPRGER